MRFLWCREVVFWIRHSVVASQVAFTISECLTIWYDGGMSLNALDSQYSWIFGIAPWPVSAVSFVMDLSQDSQIWPTYLILIILSCLDVAPLGDGLGDDLPLITVLL